MGKLDFMKIPIRRFDRIKKKFFFRFSKNYYFNAKLKKIKYQ